MSMTGPFKGRCPIILWTLVLLSGILILSPTGAAEDIIDETFPSPHIFVHEGEAITFEVTLVPEVNGTDAIVQWYMDGSPVMGDGLTYTFDTGFEDAGEYKVTVIVVHNATSDSHDWALTVLDVKEKFTITGWDPNSDILVREGKVETFSVTIDNPSNDTLSYRWYIDGEYQLGTNSSRFVLVPGMDDQGQRSVKVTVESMDHSERIEWKVGVEDGLEVRPLGDVEILEGRSMEFTVLAPDMFDNEIEWFLDSPLTQIGTGKTFVYTPDHLSAGDHLIVMNSTRGLEHTWTVTVLDVNRPPSVAPGMVKRVTVGDEAHFDGQASDLDNDIVKYEWDFDGDGVYDFSSDAPERASHVYDGPGTYLATFRVTDSQGQTATTTFQYVVSEPGALSGWYMGSIAIAIILVLVLAWIVLDRVKERKEAALGTEAMAEVPIGPEEEERPEERPKEELPYFDDIEEKPKKRPEDMEMVPYMSKMADRDMSAEGDADDTEIGVGAHGTEPTDRPEKKEGVLKEGEDLMEKDSTEELDDILKSLLPEALGKEPKADLKSKKASAEAGAGDTDTDIAIGPSARRSRPKKAKKKVKKKAKKKKAEEKAADSDIEAQDDVDLIMQDLIDKGLAERRKKG